jgi:hypothetical protein
LYSGHRVHCASARRKPLKLRGLGSVILGGKEIPILRFRQLDRLMCLRKNSFRIAEQIASAAANLAGDSVP